jgi:cytosine/adenosine deaminase-related metal-dependent hydrolase
MSHALATPTMIDKAVEHLIYALTEATEVATPKKTVMIHSFPQAGLYGRNETTQATGLAREANGQNHRERRGLGDIPPGSLQGISENSNAINQGTSNTG